MSFPLRVQGLGAFWPGANMTGSEFRRERLGQERLGQGAKWQYGRLECDKGKLENTAKLYSSPELCSLGQVSSV